MPKPELKPKRNEFRPIRWTINAASKEFGAHRQTLAKKLASFGIAPDKEDECFSTFQIFTALNGDAEYKAERLRKLREEADRVQDENAANRLKYIEKRSVAKFLDIHFTKFRAFILSMPVSRDEKDLWLDEAQKMLNGSLEQYVLAERDRNALAAISEDRATDSDSERGSESLSEP